MHAGRLRTMFLCTVGSGALFLGACSTSNTIPATAPDTTAATTTTVATTTTSTSTSTTTAPTTTLDRKAEIEAIFQDLEQRRLTALYEGDQKAFRALYANKAYLREDLESFGLAVFTTAPDAAVTVLQIRTDTEECMASVIELERVDLGVASEPHTVVLQPTTDGWGFAYVFEGEEGWLCDGPHPLQS